MREGGIVIDDCSRSTDTNLGKTWLIFLLMDILWWQVVTLGPVYHVKSGETLSGIAARFRTTIRSLLSLNPDVDVAGFLATGQPLCLSLCTEWSGPAHYKVRMLILSLSLSLSLVLIKALSPEWAWLSACPLQLLLCTSNSTVVNSQRWSQLALRPWHQQFRAYTELFHTK